MSFIYEDEKLILEFMKLAQVAAPAKTNVPNTAVSPDTRVSDIAKQLVKNLQTQMSGGNLFTAERDDADVHVKNLVSLNELVFFLYFNGIKYNGKSLTLKAGEFKDPATGNQVNILSGLGDDAKLYSAYPTESPQYYIYKDGLEKYLRDLQAKNNPVLNALIGKRIDDINNQLKFNFSKEPATQPHDPNDPNWKGVLTMHPAKPGGKPEAVPQAQAQVSQLINEIVNNLPLARENIDFNRIDRFLDSYTKLIEINPDKAKAAMSNIANARAAMTEAQKFTDTRVFGGLTNLNANTVQYWINKQNKATAYSPFVGSLRQVVTSTANVINDFASSFSDMLKQFPAMLDKINYQTGGGTSFEFTNVDKMDWLRRNPPVALVGNRR